MTGLHGESSSPEVLLTMDEDPTYQENFTEDSNKLIKVLYK